MKTSYPFLSLSQLRNVAYVDVLTWADWCAPQMHSHCSIEQFKRANERLDNATKDIIADHVAGKINIADQVPRLV